MISIFRPYVSWLSRIYALKVLCGKQIAEGKVVRVFEKEFADYFRTFSNKVVSVNSGTSALELAYELAGIGEGDEVITPVLTCTATNLPLVRRGAKIVFADINDSLNINIEDVERKITAKTKAIVFVHFGGNGSGLRQLLALARRRNIRVIEDAAQSVGADIQTWGLADYTCVSLQAIKTLTAGDGGFLICRDAIDAAKARRLRWFGYDRALKQKLGDTDLVEAGYKYHMNDVNAAIGLGNLRSLKRILARRERVREYYRQEIKRYKWPAHVRIHLHPWLAVLMIPNAPGWNRFAKLRGIQSSPYHYRNDKYSVFGGRASTMKDELIKGKENEYIWTSQVPNMDRLNDGYTLLPFHYALTRKQVRHIIGSLAFYAWR